MKTFVIQMQSSCIQLKVKADKTQTLLGSGNVPILQFVQMLTHYEEHVVAEFQWPSIIGYYEQDFQA